MSLHFSIVLCLIAPLHAIAAETPTMSCFFEKAIQVIHATPASVDSESIKQIMKIVGGKTDLATLKLDGTLRATNSRVWKELPLVGWETWESKFVGDFQEILSLAHNLGANKNPLRGRYRASLTSPGADKTLIIVGTCLVE
jgi:hypothetical protein